MDSQHDELFDDVGEVEEQGYPDLTSYDIDPNQMGLTEEDLKILRAQIKEDDFRASAEDYVDFLATPVWEDLRTNAIKRIITIRDKLESMDSTKEEDLMNKARLHELRMSLAYPASVIKILKLVEDRNEE